MALVSVLIVLSDLDPALGLVCTCFPLLCRCLVIPSATGKAKDFVSCSRLQGLQNRHQQIRIQLWLQGR